MEELIIDNIVYDLDKRIIKGFKENEPLNLLLLLYKYKEYSSLYNLNSDFIYIGNLILKLKYNCLCS